MCFNEIFLPMKKIIILLLHNYQHGSSQKIIYTDFSLLQKAKEDSGSQRRQWAVILKEKGKLSVKTLCPQKWHLKREELGSQAFTRMVWVQSLVRELKSCKLHSTAKIKEKRGGERQKSRHSQINKSRGSVTTRPVLIKNAERALQR